MNATDRFDSLFQFFGERYGVSWRLLKEQARAESRLDPDAVSPVGAKGLAQFMERTWLEWRDGTPGIQDEPPGRSLRADDPEDAIRAQAAYMAWLFRQPAVNREIPKALAAYNYGIGNLGRLIARHGANWAINLPRETIDYISRIQRGLLS